MASEFELTMTELLRRFRDKFGRDPEPSDPIFFDPDADTPTALQPETMNEMWKQLADSMELRGEITPQTAYAMRETGMLVTSETEHLLTQDQREKWNQALEAYRRTQPLRELRQPDHP